MFIQWKSLTRLLSVRTSWLTRIESNFTSGYIFHLVTIDGLDCLVISLRVVFITAKINFSSSFGFFGPLFRFALDIIISSKKKTTSHQVLPLCCP